MANKKRNPTKWRDEKVSTKDTDKPTVLIPAPDITLRNQAGEPITREDEVPGPSPKTTTPDDPMLQSNELSTETRSDFTLQMNEIQRRRLTSMAKYWSLTEQEFLTHLLMREWVKLPIER